MIEDLSPVLPRIFRQIYEERWTHPANAHFQILVPARRVLGGGTMHISLPI